VCELTHKSSKADLLVSNFAQTPLSRTARLFNICTLFDNGRRCPFQVPINTRILHARVLIPIGRRQAIHNMQTHNPAFHAEYWVYLLAALVTVVLGTLLYTMDGPIKFSSWF
jgi:hypothetical protein